MKRKNKRIIFIIICMVLVALLVNFIIIWNKVQPLYKGEVDSNKKRIINDCFKIKETCHPVNDYIDAYREASKLYEKYNDDYKWYKMIYGRDVYYDEENDCWFVYIFLDIPDILDGDVLIVISGDGQNIYAQSMIDDWYINK